MKKPESTKMVNSLIAKDLEVFSEPKPKRPKGNEPVGYCQCGLGMGCGGSGS